MSVNIRAGIQHHRLEAPAGQVELSDPVLSQGDTQFLQRPLGGVVVARGGLGSEGARRQGRPVQGNLFIPLEGGSLVLISTSRVFPQTLMPSCPSASLALSLARCVTS